ncbi:MAG: 3-methyl-2-oxobutanoate hydroxymethyltransferase [Desulfurococcales archaeon]|nr:3-methyl-2-oxobutanoate hydroxymethyltransferase [Desulfurococcales archaeon]
MKKQGKKIVMITAYDYFQARIADEVGVDGILVGDSLGMVVMGYKSTLAVTLDDIVHHTKAVLNAVPRALVVADMPFMSYEAGKDEALRNAGRLIKLGADAVKLEGGIEVADTVKALVSSGIPVMGHIGLNPQRHLVMGGYRLRGKCAKDAVEVLEDAEALEEAGAFAVIIEFTAAEVAAEVTKRLKIPTICIGSGPHCDGQILVFHDVVGLNPEPPMFVKKYAQAYEDFKNAISTYKIEVESGSFPTKDKYHRMKEGELQKFKELISHRRRRT